jgi:5-methylcytosine-specific restriction endonuclease McrA
MQTYEFDDVVLSRERFRFHVLRCPSTRKHRKKLIEGQKTCPLCGKPLDGKVEIDHIKSVKSFADDLSIPLTEAYVRCHSLENLRAVHHKCNNGRNRKIPNHGG